MRLLLVALALLLLVTATPTAGRRQLLRQKASRTLLLDADASPPQQPHQALPVFFFHGVLSNARSGYRFAANLTAEGRVFVPLTFCDDRCSIRALNVQVQLAIAQIRAIVTGDKRFDDGYVFIGHSQGGAIARAVIEEMDDHKVRTFVSLAGVVNGVFYGPQHADELPALVFLKALGPNMIPASVWDPNAYSLADFNGTYQYDLDVFARKHLELQDQYSAFNLARSPVVGPWAEMNPFFPVQNNINPCLGANAAQCLHDQQRRRNNFLKLRAAHFFASPDDGVVAPWQSSILGQYSELSNEAEIKTKFISLRILDMKDTLEYKEDTYGLQTLDRRGGLALHTVASVSHTCWVTDSAPFGSVHPCFFDEVYDQHLYSLL